MNISANAVVIGTGTDMETANSWLAAFQSAADEFEINTPRRIAAWLANVGVESNGLKDLVENLNYSAQGLANTWPSRYAVNPHGAPFVPNQTAYELARNPQAIANNCYANRMGNGPESSGDGWACRGQGPIQITGKANITAFFTAADLPADTDPAKLQEPTLGALSAAWFFKSRGCNELADGWQISKVVQAINGQMPCAANNGPLRLSRSNACLNVLEQEAQQTTTKSVVAKGKSLPLAK